jgi:predicted dehydrogenase
VGYGFIGKRHAELIAARADAVLAAIVEPNPAQAALAHKTYPNVPVFDALQACIDQLGHGNLDALSICTPNGLHTLQAEIALNHKLHVVCEKPLGLHAAHCRTVAALAAAQDRRLFCVLQNRYSPAVQWLKDMLVADALGRLYYVGVNCFWNRDNRYYVPGSWRGTLALDGGPLFTQFSHFVDLLCFLFGVPTGLHGRFTNQAHNHNTEFEDTGIVTGVLPGGAQLNFAYTTAVPHENFESALTIIAERGVVRLGGQYMNELTHCAIAGVPAPHLPPSPPPNRYPGYTGSAANHAKMIDNVITTIAGQTLPDADALDGLRVVEVIEAMYAGRV